MTPTPGTVEISPEPEGFLGAELSAAHGHLVLDASGAPVGRLAWLRYGLDDRWPEALMVRPGGWRGLWSQRERAVPFDAVRLTVAGRREILTDLAPAPEPRPAHRRGFTRHGAG